MTEAAAAATEAAAAAAAGDLKILGCEDGSPGFSLMTNICVKKTRVENIMDKTYD